MIQKVNFFVGFWTLLYISAIVLSNFLLLWIPPVAFLGTVVPPAIVAFGFVFVLRDYSQKEIGHYVLLAIATAALLTYFFAGPAIAYASVTAFVVAELADWLVYSVTKRPMSERILISSLVSVPVDTAVFYYILNILDPWSLVVGVAIKLIGAVGFWAFLRYREQQAQSPVAA